MNRNRDEAWDHKNTVRAGTICAGHLTDAAINAVQRVIWEHHMEDEYWTVMLNAARAILEEVIAEASVNQAEWTQYLQEALVSAGERCRSANPNGEPGYKRRWQAEADARYDRMARAKAARDEQDEANRQARARRLEDEREHRS